MAGEAAIGRWVAKDFGAEHGGIFYGKVVSVEGERRKLYRAECTDGDSEDMTEAQLVYATSAALSQKEVYPRSRTAQVIRVGTKTATPTRERSRGQRKR